MREMPKADIGPYLAPTADNSSQLSMGVMARTEIKTGDAFADAVANGSQSHGDPRLNDNFTLCKTTTISLTSSLTLFPANIYPMTVTPPEYGYGFNLLIRGDGCATIGLCGAPYYDGANKWNWLMPGSATAATSATSSSVSATTAPVAGTWFAGGFCNPNLFSRPLGIVTRIVPRLLGVAHTARVFAFPVEPSSRGDWSQTASPTGYPAVTNSGLTAAQLSWGGRMFEIDPTSNGVRLACVPWDSRGMDFNQDDTDRTAIWDYGVNAWGGWAVWVNGLASGDSFDVITTTLWEVMPITTTATVYGLTYTSREANAAKADRSTNIVQKLVNDGLTGTSIVDKVIDTAKAAWGVGKKIWSAWQGFSSVVGGPTPVSSQHRTVPPKSHHSTMPIVHPVAASDEEKLDEFTPIDAVAKARRNTLSSPLSIDMPKDTSQPPASARRGK